MNTSRATQISRFFSVSRWAEMPRLVSLIFSPTSSTQSDSSTISRRVRRRHQAQIRAHELRMARRERAAAQKRRRDGQPQPLGQSNEAILQLEPVHLDADDEDRTLCSAQARGDLLHGFAHGAVVGSHLRACAVERRVNLLRDHVARDLEIHGPLGLQRHVDRAADVRGRRARIVQDGAVFGDLAVDVELGLERLHLVVHVQAGALLRAAGAAGQDDQRRFLRVGARDGVHHVQPAGAVGHAAHAQPTGHARRAVGRKPDGRLVAEPHQREAAVALEGLEQVQREIAGDAVDVPHTTVPELVEEVLVQCHGDGKTSASS